MDRKEKRWSLTWFSDQQVLPKCHLPSRGISDGGGGGALATARFKWFDSDSWSWLKEAQ